MKVVPLGEGGRAASHAEGPAPGRNTPSGRTFVEVLNEGGRGSGADARPGVAVPPVSPPTTAEGLESLVGEVAHTERLLDAAIEAALGGKTFSASELLALQVQVFRHTQTIELLSRATDRVVAALKQTLGTQV